MAVGAKPHSINQILYFGTATATPISHGKGFSVTPTTQMADSSSWGDSIATQKPGLLSLSATLTKHYDHAETAIRDAVYGRKLGKFYWYPDRADPTSYEYWTGYISGGGNQGASLNEIIGETYQISYETAPTRIQA